MNSLFVDKVQEPTLPLIIVVQFWNISKIKIFSEKNINKKVLPIISLVFITQDVEVINLKDVEEKIYSDFQKKSS